MIERCQEAQASPPLLHSPESAARALTLSRAEVFRRMKSGEIGSVRIGRLRRIPHEALVDFVAQLQQTA